MKILILNWRDIKNPNSGGAEVLTHEIAKRLVVWGNEVTQFSELFNGGKKEEIIDGVSIIRKGSANFRKINEIPVHLAAFLWYRKHKNNFDIVIDEIHGIPFFTPFYVKEKKVILVCEVANEIWDAMFSFPLNQIGKLVERNYHHFYKNTPFLTISPSTKDDLIKIGVKKDLITVLPMGITIPSKIKIYAKEQNPTVIFVGRLSRTKGIEDALFAVKEIKEKMETITFWIVGKGEKTYEKYLREKTRELDLERNVVFKGFVNQEEKFALMSRAHILVAPSLKEGWGLIVPEAGICGTPSVVYDVGGLKDIIKNNRTGIIVQPQPSLLADAIINILLNKLLYKRIQREAKNYFSHQSWDDTAKVVLSTLKNI